ncbi:conserved Plasmodium protein, unknown function [Plasmodium knowlesi strain H]|uniref:Uncharacterized protein n=3 Tax=Plasmodium knowlesi TaxID=5850 RepID=A0A5K1ULC9_PLAKH|nr:conserved Plasmodium protein, unknown function [Plasmodium knowlesi strain H]OTN65999.1 Uncharacterized protein PKNOH_S100038900 [Plasmodium knowlesi]CAA9987752.1 conserved Plasmodium protein, unknown function [Plasmodium knowlesi strain H]SBO27076.1 conserved Plasmodium protein, unknown function [Plasmodium knowlesi strain H]SBO29445.1 conserved Plasmodium protein, unknown function [Plasmodium knowlesi strain H]VVS77226.1 conserved Plasmodium protein, unknown function [Plasmodium knowlesi |eukprot:XP_002258749.1 hypothetical protein, conserved in Plasmodium species [Plasmodium knowlesi strain H]
MDELDKADEVSSPSEEEKAPRKYRKRRKNYRELYTDYNERRNSKIDFSYYINMEATIMELLLDNNMESFKNAGKLLFVILSGLSPKVMYLKRVLDLVDFFFYKGGMKFYHSDMHLKILLFIFNRIKFRYMIPRPRIFNLLMCKNNIKELEKYKYVYTPRINFLTYVDHLYYHVKDFMIAVREILMQDWIQKVQAKALSSSKSREDVLKKLKVNEKIAIYKETDEEVLIHFSKLFKTEYAKSMDKTLKRLIENCIVTNFPLHSIYLDIYILYNINNVVKLLVVIDQLFCSLFSYYYFYELKLKLLLLHIHRCQMEVPPGVAVTSAVGTIPIADPKSDATDIGGGRKIEAEDDTSPNVSPSTKNAINSILLMRSLGGRKSDENSTLMYDESSVGNANYQLGQSNERELRKLLKLRNKQKQEANECLNSLYSSDSNKSDNSNLSEKAMKHNFPQDQQYNENNDNENNLYLDAFMNLYINSTEGMVNSLPSLSELNDAHPLKQLNQKIRSKRAEGNLNSIFFHMPKDPRMNDISSVGMSMMEHTKDLLDENELDNHFNIKQSEQLAGDESITIKKEKNKKVKRASLPKVENIHKGTYNDMAYNISLVANAAKSLLHSSNYDPIYVKLFYLYLLPIISFEKRVDIFLIYSFTSYKIMKPLIFIIFYNNHTSTYILNTVKQIFKQDKFLFEKYKSTYFNGLSLRDIPKSHFIFLFLLSVFFYDHKAESLLYMFKLFCNYDEDVISDQERDINYKKIHEDVVLENDEKYTEEKKSINIIIIKFIEIYQEKFGTHLCDYFDFYRIFFILFASCVDMA